MAALSERGVTIDELIQRKNLHKRARPTTRFGEPTLNLDDGSGARQICKFFMDRIAVYRSTGMVHSLRLFLASH